jgi:hypothetical protein
MADIVLTPAPVSAVSDPAPRYRLAKAPEGLYWTGTGKSPTVVHLVPGGSEGWQSLCSTQVPMRAVRLHAVPRTGPWIPRLCLTCLHKVGFAVRAPLDPITRQVLEALPEGREFPSSVWREVARHVGISPANVAQRRRKLEREGLLLCAFETDRGSTWRVVRHCRLCLCTEDRACFGGCGWAGLSVCSACAPEVTP